jgi:predicted amidophosphoribosyltransferase
LVPAPLLDSPAGVDGLWCLLSYQDVGRRLVHGVKYRGQRATLTRLGPALAGLVDDVVDVVTWVPASRRHRRVRGYDQARVLARAVARALAVDCRPLLRRGSGPPQTGRSVAERARGPALRVRAGSANRRVLIVDDVVTTGASMRVAAGVLRSAGAQAVSGVALARTPLKAASPSAERFREQ